MTTTTKRPIAVSFDVGYGTSNNDTFTLFRETPELTKVHVGQEGTSFDGTFTVEFYVDSETDNQVFVDAFLERVVATIPNGQLVDDTWITDGELGALDKNAYDVWVFIVRGAPVV